MRLPDFWKCPICGADCVKYTRSKNNEAMYLCNGCGKDLKLKFGKKKVVEFVL